ncbi:LppX_LprAFG lipoprotein [Nocardiopsis gilva]|nr:LppX_LprAFG lipoprotein [Nocardiopsis gilva]
MAVGGLALVTTACGGGAAEDAPEKTHESEPQQETAATKPSDIFELLGTKTAELDNYRVDVEMTVEDEEIGTYRPSFSYQVMDDPEAILMDVDFGEEFGDALVEAMGGEEPPGGLDAFTHTTLVYVGDDVYVKNDHGLHGDAPWVRSTDESREDMPDVELDDFIDLTEALSQVDDVKEAGTEEINGQETTHFTGSLTQKAIDATEDADKRETLKELFDGEIEGQLDFDVWADADSIPHRVTLKDDEVDMTMEFSEIGKVSFEVPAEDEIGEMKA